MRRLIIMLSMAAIATGCGGDESTTTPVSKPSDDVPASTSEQEAWPDDLVVSPEHGDLEPPADAPTSELAERLPMTVNDARLRIVGVTGDGERSIVQVSSAQRSEDELRSLYRDLLEAYGDDGSLLQPQFDTAGGEDQ